LKGSTGYPFKEFDIAGAYLAGKSRRSGKIFKL
jgi:hypothetical protein